VVSKASERSLFDHFQTVYIRIYTEKPYIYVLYGVYIRRTKFIYGVYEYGYGENLFIHTYIYGMYINMAYIYIYGLGQPYIYASGGHLSGSLEKSL